MGEHIKGWTEEVTTTWIPALSSQFGYLTAGSSFFPFPKSYGFTVQRINLSGVASDKLPLLSAISRKFVLDTGDVSGAWVQNLVLILQHPAESISTKPTVRQLSLETAAVMSVAMGSI